MDVLSNIKTRREVFGQNFTDTRDAMVSEIRSYLRSDYVSTINAEQFSYAGTMDLGRKTVAAILSDFANQMLADKFNGIAGSESITANQFG